MEVLTVLSDGKKFGASAKRSLVHAYRVTHGAE